MRGLLGVVPRTELCRSNTEDWRASFLRRQGGDAWRGMSGHHGPKERVKGEEPRRTGMGHAEWLDAI